ncbi:hypothetical protein EV182_003899, partial [Spiromyces aspiralis]
LYPIRASDPQYTPRTHALAIMSLLKKIQRKKSGLSRPDKKSRHSSSKHSVNFGYRTPLFKTNSDALVMSSLVK